MKEKNSTKLQEMQYIPNQKHIRNSNTNRCPCGNILKVYIWSLQKPDDWKSDLAGAVCSRSHKNIFIHSFYFYFMDANVLSH